MDWLIDDEVRERIERLDIPFNEYGLDPYGISREHLGMFFSAMKWFYRNYFDVKVYGAEHIPKEEGAFIIGNHSGGIPVDAAMVLTSLILDLDDPRLGHAMVERFVSNVPFLTQLYSRFGQFTGLPEHATRFVRDGRLVVAFPEGVRGIGKLYTDRYQLVRFGTGFVRLAMKAGVPIVPFAFVGGEEAYPVAMRLETIGKMVGAPFLPVPKHVVPVPLPVSCQIHYGEPICFEGDGTEADEVIVGYVDEVKRRVAALIEGGRDLRRDRFNPPIEFEPEDI